VPAFEAAGIVVRVPDWWKKRSRLGVEVKLGGRKPAGLGLDALVDFDVRLALDGEPLSEREWRALAAQDHGLAGSRTLGGDPSGQARAGPRTWKEAQRVARGGGLSLLEAMRLLAGAEGEAAAPLEPDVADWSRVSAGPWLAQALPACAAGRIGKATSRLRAARRATALPGGRCAMLSFAAGLGLGTCLADDMGLARHCRSRVPPARKKAGQGPRHQACCRAGVASGKLERGDRAFAPTLRIRVEHPSAHEEQAEDADLNHHDVRMLLRNTAIASADWTWPSSMRRRPSRIPARARPARQGAEGARADRADRHSGREPASRSVVDLDFLNRLARVGPGIREVHQETGESRIWPARELTRPYLLRRLKTTRT